jgi:hypothetical protein
MPVYVMTVWVSTVHIFFVEELLGAVIEFDKLVVVAALALESALLVVVVAAVVPASL